MGAILRWCLKGHSAGRGTTHADDLVLTCLSNVLLTIANLSADRTKQTGIKGISALCSSAAKDMRECAVGQFATMAQGASGIRELKTRGHGGEWQKAKRVTNLANTLLSQVRPQLEAAARGEIQLEELGARRVVMIEAVNKSGLRRIEITPPDAYDWKLLSIARHVGTGSSGRSLDSNAEVWASFALMILACAQAEAGWFDVVTFADKRKRKGHWKMKSLALSAEAHTRVSADLVHWLQAGFVNEPMIVPPQDGGYLTVKHRAVSSKTGPGGLKTKAEDTFAWQAASEVIAGTAWSVPPLTLEFLRARPDVVERSEPDLLRREALLGAHRRLATEERFYLPIFMDFRGRVYTRPSFVTYQGGDLQKGLLCFPENGNGPIPEPPHGGYSVQRAPNEECVLAKTMHIAALMGHDKATLESREAAIWSLADVMNDVNRRRWDGKHLSALLEASDEPVQLLTALTLESSGQWDRMAVQLDGTCNGLQHLSAMFRDETAAPNVNLMESTLQDCPSDLYLDIAQKVQAKVRTIKDPWAYRVDSNLKIDRKLMKRPVMVLPYGGTLVTIEEQMMAGALEQAPQAFAWKTCNYFVPGEGWRLDEAAKAAGYLAFADRDLAEHPLFRSDMQKLGRLVWECISEALPKAMQAMDAFREIARKCDGHALQWKTGWEDNALWVTQAYDKSVIAQSRVKGFHLPAIARSMSMVKNTDEIAIGKGTNGIVANFIHSNDAAHLARTAHLFHQGYHGRSLGTVHDCLLTRPSEAAGAGAAVRGAFAMRYEDDPLFLPVRLIDPKDKTAAHFPSWYALAEYLGVSFPDKGSWEPAEVLKSAWFFS